MRKAVLSIALGCLLTSISAFAAGPAVHGAKGKSLEAAPLQAPQEEAPSKLEFLEVRSSAVSGPLPIGTEDDVYCSGWIGTDSEVFLGTLASAEKIDSQKSFIQGDIVYVDLGASRGAIAGQEFVVCRPERSVYKYDSVSDEVGRIYLTPGRIRILCVQENSSIAEVVLSCADLQMGDYLMPFEPIPIPLVRRTRPATSCDTDNGKLMGHIIATRENVTPIAEDTVVFLDLGDLDGLNAGDFLTVFRTRHGAYGVRTILGEAAVLTTRGHTAVAKITSMQDVMGAGDEVQLK
jgi:hypothetical protein